LSTPALATRLPENAYTPLPPGVAYQPVVPACQAPPELTARSIWWGLFLCVVFTVASAYSGLKVAQVMEAAIPISILAIGLSRMYPRRSTLLENVIITGIGGLAGSVVAGAVFTLPALYLLKLDPHPVQTIFICLAGGCLGVLFLIPLRRYFVRDMHGVLPTFGSPRCAGARACDEIANPDRSLTIAARQWPLVSRDCKGAVGMTKS